jgi:hypothetical protein
MALLNTRLITAPTSEPITLAQAKIWLNIPPTNTMDDALITGLIVAARQYCESETNRVFFPQTWQMTLDYFPLWFPNGTTGSLKTSQWIVGAQLIRDVAIELPKPRCTATNDPTNGVTGVTITYYDQSGTQQTFPATSFTVDTTSEPARLMPNNGTWALAQIYRPGSIQITFTCGEWTPTTIPQTIVTAMYLLVSYWYTNRNAVTPMTMTAAPMGVDALLSDSRFLYLGFGN